MDLKKGTVLDERYRISSYLGSGGMAEVYLATDIISKMDVAVKVIRNDMMDSPVNSRRFENETTIAASLNHPNIVKVYNQGTIDSRPYFVQEFIRGQTLKNVLDVRGTFLVDEAVDYMIQLLAALNYAHAHNVVHRDVKPDNIFLLSDGTIKLCDFGIALADGIDFKTSEFSDKIVGSVHYLAPEIAKGGLASPASDIYACGVTLFELVTGHTPFNGKTPIEVCVAQINEKFPTTKKYVFNVPKEVEQIIIKATMKDPGKRFNSAKEFQEALLAYKNSDEHEEKKKGLLSRLFGFK